MATIGIVPGSSPTVKLTINASGDNQRASVTSATVAEDYTVTQLSAWVKRNGSDGRMALAIWEVLPDGSPGNLIAQTERFNAPNVGTVVTYAVVNLGEVAAGSQVAFGGLVASGSVDIGLAATGSGTTFRRSVNGAIRNPFGTATSATGTPMAISATVVPAGVVAGDATIPATPSYLQPANGSRNVGTPAFRWNATDPSGRTLLGYFELTKPDGSVVTTTVGQPVTGEVWTFPNGSGDVAWLSANASGIGNYTWRVRSRTLGSPYEYGNWSGYYGFAVDRSLSPIITYPQDGAIVPSLRPTVTWSLGTNDIQRKYRVSLATITGDVVAQSEIIAGSQQTYQLPAGWPMVRNRDYGLRLEVWGDTNTPATDTNVFSFGFAASAALPSVTVTGYQFAGEREASTPIIEWGASNLAANVFAGTVIKRRLASETSDYDVVIAHVMNQDLHEIWDTNAPSNVELTYTVYELANNSGVITSGDAVEVNYTPTLKIPIIASAWNGTAIRFPVMVLGTGMAGSFTRPETTVTTWGGSGKPTLLSTPASYGKQTLSLSWILTELEAVTAQERLTAIRTLVESGEPVVCRLESNRLFGRIVNWRWGRRNGVGTLAVNLDVEEIAYTEGLSLEV